MNTKSIIIGITVLALLGAAGLVYYVSRPAGPDKPAQMASLSSVLKNQTSATTQITITSTLMKLTSSVFENNGEIPKKYTCDGDDISPPLAVAEIPAEAVSLVLIVDDPDAPAGDWVHWVVFNIPASTTSIGEGADPSGVEGMTDFGESGWGGPCPPSGTHRYFFELYALDTELDLDASATKAEVETAITGHVLDRAELVGLYSRS